MADTLEVRSPADQEGTKAVVLRWCHAIGERVEKDQPLLELETDKVTVEVPSPASGLLEEILKQVNDDVAPGDLLARIRPGDAASTKSAAVASEVAAAALSQPAVSSASIAAETARGELSPAVRRLLAEHSLSPEVVTGSGRGGRITAEDVLAYVAKTAAVAPRATTAATIRPHTAMRRRIAENMAHSLATAPHVTTVFEADLSRVIAHRNRHLAAYQQQGVPLTLTAYFVAASAAALVAVPEVNSTYHADHLELHPDCNIGIGTALGNDGLIVPVVHGAQKLDLAGTARKIAALVTAARAGTLTADAVRGGTFTISNHGVSGSLLAAPIIINQPQVAILGVGKAQRRVVVDEIDGEDVQRVRSMCYLTLTIDHRALDAFQANAFLTKVVATLETWPLDAV